jgi:menaquinone-dependent protoporphyrinogen oxidase
MLRAGQQDVRIAVDREGAIFQKRRRVMIRYSKTITFSPGYAAVMAVCALVTLCAFPGGANAFRERPETVIEKSCGQENPSGKKILVAYDTKYGATATVAERIGDTLCENGFQADIRMARTVATDELSGYDAAVIGSAIISEMWLPGSFGLLSRGASILAGKPVAYFVVCMSMRNDNEETRERVTKYYIDPIMDIFSDIVPAVDAGLFAGRLDYEQTYFFDTLLLKLLFGAEEGDWRDLDKVAAWTLDVAEAFE